MSEQGTTTTTALEADATPNTIGAVPTEPDTAPPAAVEAPPADPPGGEHDDNYDPEKIRAKIRKQNQENAALRASKKAAEDKAAESEVTAAEVPELRAKLLVAEVALELGMPANLAKRLQGTTRDELLADAEELLAQVAPPKAPAPSRPVENLTPGSGGAPEPTLEDQITAARSAGDVKRVIALESSKLSGSTA